MSWDRKSIGAWAGSVAETLLRDATLTGLPCTARTAVEGPDPAGSSCRNHQVGHAPHRVRTLHAAELRQRGDAEQVRCVEHSLVEAGTLVWSADAVEGSDPSRLVTRLRLERPDGTTLSVLTHDQRAIAPIEACDGEGLWWVPRSSIVSIPSWDEAFVGAAQEPRSWQALSVVLSGQPWLPCPIAPPRTRSRPR